MCLVCKGRLDKVKKGVLYCTACPTLTEISVIPGLKKLWCTNCPLLTKISVIPGLKKLYCSNNPLLEEIPYIPGLVKIECTRCPLIKKIPTQYGYPCIPELKQLWCIDTPLLTKVPSLEFLRCYNCPWLSEYVYNDIQQGLKLQRWIKNNFKYFVFRRWINSIEGKEFLYHPDHIGGRIEKAKMEKTLLSLN